MDPEGTGLEEEMQTDAASTRTDGNFSYAAVAAGAPRPPPGLQGIRNNRTMAQGSSLSLRPNSVGTDLANKMLRFGFGGETENNDVFLEKNDRCPSGGHGSANLPPA